MPQVKILMDNDIQNGDQTWEDTLIAFAAIGGVPRGATIERDADGKNIGVTVQVEGLTDQAIAAITKDNPGVGKSQIVPKPLRTLDLTDISLATVTLAQEATDRIEDIRVFSAIDKLEDSTQLGRLANPTGVGNVYEDDSLNTFDFPFTVIQFAVSNKTATPNTLIFPPNEVTITIAALGAILLKNDNNIELPTTPSFPTAFAQFYIENTGRLYPLAKTWLGGFVLPPISYFRAVELGRA